MSADRLNIGGGISVPAGPHAAEWMNLLGSGPDYRVHGRVVRENAVAPKTVEVAGAPAEAPELPMIAAGVAAAAEYMPR